MDSAKVARMVVRELALIARRIDFDMQLVCVCKYLIWPDQRRWPILTDSVVCVGALAGSVLCAALLVYGELSTIRLRPS
jgi:hypothetical protein